MIAISTSETMIKPMICYFFCYLIYYTLRIFSCIKDSTENVWNIYVLCERYYDRAMK